MGNQTFDQAIEGLLEREGGYVDDPHDRGGATKYGISLLLLRDNNLDLTGDGIVDKKDIQALTLAQAKEIYLRHFWDWLHCSDLPGPLALMVFDLGVNTGRSRAAESLQAAVNTCLEEPAKPLAEDGVIGPLTIEAAKRQYEQNRVSLLTAFLSKVLSHYTGCRTWPEHGKGWMNRWANTLAEVSRLEDDI